MVTVIMVAKYKEACCSRSAFLDSNTSVGASNGRICPHC